MDESPPLPASPEKAVASKSAAASEEKAAQEKAGRWRLRPRLPASLVATLLVALLSVLVGPAFVRQWEDRKKAHELQAETADASPVQMLAWVTELTNAADAEWRKLRQELDV
jgi:hypothetical protein